MNKLVLCAWLLSGALEILRLRLRLRLDLRFASFGRGCFITQSAPRDDARGAMEAIHSMAAVVAGVAAADAAYAARYAYIRKSLFKATCISTMGAFRGVAGSNSPNELLLLKQGPSIKYVTLFLANFDHLPPPVTLCHTSRDPLESTSHISNPPDF